MVGGFHKVAADRITSQGLGLWPRMILAVFSSLFAVVMFLTAPDDSKAIYFYLFGGLCAVVAAACICSGKARQFFGSIVGLALVVLTGWYLYSELREGPFLSQRLGEPSQFKAILFAFAFGLPGLRYVIKTGFGFRRNA